MPTEQQQAIADIPLWLLVAVSMAGLSGEMLRASGLNMTTRQLAQRVLLRFSASGFSGMAAFLLTYSQDVNVYSAVAVGIGTALIGADVVVAMTAQWAAKKAGIGRKAEGQ